MSVAAAPAARPILGGVERRHFPALEGLRAVAAFAVFVHHLGFWTGATFSSRFGPFLARLDVGVPVFFAISGFLLFRAPAVSLLDGTASVAAKPFWWKRLWRIYPVYWVVLTVVLVVPRLSEKPPLIDLPLHYLLLQIYPTDKFFEGISQSWSLAVEVSFYALLPLFAARLHGLMDRRSVSRSAVRLLAIVAGCALGSVLFRVAVFSLTEGDAFRMIFWLGGTIDYFAIGMTAAVILVWGERRPAGQRLVDALRGPAWPWIALATTALFIASTGLDLDAGLGRSSWHLELLRQACYDLVAIGVLIPAVFGPHDGERSGPVRSLLQSRPLVWFGAISYSFYLWHLAVIEWFFKATNTQQFLNWDRLSIYSGQVVWIFLGTLVGTTLLSALTYYLVERPVADWSRNRVAGT